MRRQWYLTRCLQVSEVAVAQVAAIEVGLRDRCHYWKVDARLPEHALVDFRVVHGGLHVRILRVALLHLWLVAGIFIVEILLESRCSSSLGNNFGWCSVSLWKVQWKAEKKHENNIIDVGNVAAIDSFDFGGIISLTWGCGEATASGVRQKESALNTSGWYNWFRLITICSHSARRHRDWRFIHFVKVGLGGLGVMSERAGECFWW